MSLETIEPYLRVNTLTVVKQLGFGIHGRVWSVRGPNDRIISAIKLFEDESPFERELAVYERLNEENCHQVGQFRIPRLLDSAPEYPLIRISIVQRPFCLDFASAYLDELPAYFPPFDEAWHQEKENQFGSADWPE
ncbi:MAG: hypothetical protein AAF236_17210, partial [Verrucomicrobiota bacterium]